MIFFEPLQLHLEPADLLEEFGLAGLGVSRGRPGRAGPLKIASAPVRSCFFQAWINVGWTSNCPASSLTVRSPLRAARATLALNGGVWIFRLPAIVTPLLSHRTSLTDGPVFGVHYSR